MTSRLHAKRFRFFSFIGGSLFFALSSSGKEASTPNSALMATEQPLSYFVIWLLATLCRKEFF